MTVKSEAAVGRTAWQAPRLGRLPLATFVVLLAAAALHADGSAVLGLQYDRSAVSQGELWRLLTGHLTHYTTTQLFWNGSTFFVFGSYVEIVCCRSKGLFLTIMLCSALAVSAGMYLLCPEMQLYRGLSAGSVLYFTWFVLDSLRSALQRFDVPTALAAAGLLAALSAKMIYEALGNPALLAADHSFSVAPWSHCLGALSALTAFWAGFALESGGSAPAASRRARTDRTGC